MSTPGEAVLNRVKQHRERAAEIERFAPHVARVLREAADDYERDVMKHTPEWWTLSAVQATKGWSMKTLRRRAERLEPEGRARKDPHWEIRWDAVYAMADAPSRTEEIEVGDDLDELALELATSA